MGCFIVPLGQAIVTTVIQKVVEKNEKKSSVPHTETTGISWSRKLGWLNKMLWGGSALLVLEHVWHGEIILQAPFLTAMSSPGDMAILFREIATVGVAMSVIVTLVWGIIVMIAEQKTRNLPEVKAISIKGA